MAKKNRTLISPKATITLLNAMNMVTIIFPAKAKKKTLVFKYKHNSSAFKRYKKLKEKYGTIEGVVETA